MDYELTAWSMGLVLVVSGAAMIGYFAMELLEELRESRRKRKLERLMGRRHGGD
ncbi:MAG: hypothetical protein KGL26_01095 [Pseudomonadota bacterium]|nr:hypothetical protein [Pseudomonadota bacterium]